MPTINHPNRKEFNERTGADEPVQINPHLLEEPWEYDPDYTAKENHPLIDETLREKNIK